MVRSIVLRSVAGGVVAALALCALPAQAQWKWRDATGHTQYSDLPPPAGTPDKDILNRPAVQARRVSAEPASAVSSASAASQALMPRTVDPVLEAKRKKAEQEQAAKAKADEAKLAATKADNCARARTQLRTLDSGVRLARVNDKGEREFLTDQQRANEARQAHDAISSSCN